MTVADGQKVRTVWQMGFDIFFNNSSFDPASEFRNKLTRSSMMKTLLLNEKSNRENRNENYDENNNDEDLLVQGEDEKRAENKNPSPPLGRTS